MEQAWLGPAEGTEESLGLGVGSLVSPSSRAWGAQTPVTRRGIFRDSPVTGKPPHYPCGCTVEELVGAQVVGCSRLHWVVFRVNCTRSFPAVCQGQISAHLMPQFPHQQNKEP